MVPCLPLQIQVPITSTNGRWRGRHFKYVTEHSEERGNQIGSRNFIKHELPYLVGIHKDIAPSKDNWERILKDKKLLKRTPALILENRVRVKSKRSKNVIFNENLSHPWMHDIF